MRLTNQVFGIFKKNIHLWIFEIVFFTAVISLIWLSLEGFDGRVTGFTTHETSLTVTLKTRLNPGKAPAQYSDNPLATCSGISSNNYCSATLPSMSLTDQENAVLLISSSSPNWAIGKLQYSISKTNQLDDDYYCALVNTGQKWAYDFLPPPNNRQIRQSCYFNDVQDIRLQNEVKIFAYTVNLPPQGEIGNIYCDAPWQFGWACDPDNYDKPLTVYLYEGKLAPGKTPIATGIADKVGGPFLDMPCGNRRNHVFSNIALPSSIKDGYDHEIYAYVDNTRSDGVISGEKQLLINTGKNKINCDTVPKYFLTNDCSKIYGGACDEQNYNQPINVEFYTGAPKGEPDSVHLGNTIANLQEKVNSGSHCGGTSNHGFEFMIPDSLKDNKLHKIHSFFINIPDANKFPNQQYGYVSILCEGGVPDIVTKQLLTVPGKIETEDFDLQGYFDKTEGNSGGAYRPNANADIYSGGSNHYVLMEPGESLVYTVDVQQTGVYLLNMMAKSSGSSFLKISKDTGRQELGTLKLEKTVDFEKKSVQFSLFKGKYKFKLENVGNVPVELDYLDFLLQEPKPTAKPDLELTDVKILSKINYINNKRSSSITSARESDVKVINLLYSINNNEFVPTDGTFFNTEIIIEKDGKQVGSSVYHKTEKTLQDYELEGKILEYALSGPGVYCFTIKIDNENKIPEESEENNKIKNCITITSLSLLTLTDKTLKVDIVKQGYPGQQTLFEETLKCYLENNYRLICKGEKFVPTMKEGGLNLGVLNLYSDKYRIEKFKLMTPIGADDHICPGYSGRWNCERPAVDMYTKYGGTVEVELVPLETYSVTPTPTPTQTPPFDMQACINDCTSPKIDECSSLCGEGMTKKILKCNANCLKLETKKCKGNCKQKEASGG